MRANNSKPYLDYWSKLADKHNNSYQHSINKNPIHADYSVLHEEFESNHKSPKSKVVNGIRITKYKNILIKGCTGKLSEEIFIIDNVLKTNPWTYKIKELIGEKVIWIFYEKEFLLI